MWPFKRVNTFLLPDDEEWHLAVWGWLLARFGEADFKADPLVTPTRAFFPPTDAIGHARAEHIFHCTLGLAGMAEWPCELVAQPQRPNRRVSELGYVKNDRGELPAGTFSRAGNKAQITYDPDSVSEPAALIATFAHELAHYLLHSVHDLPPGQQDMEEFATDLSTVFLGFGLFSANQAFNFSQYRDIYSQGWRTSRLGYLSERDWAFALAVYCALRGEDTVVLKPWLKTYLYSDVRKAARYLKKGPQILAKIREHQAAYAA